MHGGAVSVHSPLVVMWDGKGLLELSVPCGKADFRHEIL